MIKLNSIGAIISSLPYVQAMTDVTGFGLLGHLSEMCEGSGVQAKLDMDQIALLPFVHDYLDKGCIPGGTNRNWLSYGHKVSALSEQQRAILADPQTSGGLLVAIDADASNQFEAILREHQIPEANIQSIGYLEEKKGSVIITV